MELVAKVFSLEASNLSKERIIDGKNEKIIVLKPKLANLEVLGIESKKEEEAQRNIDVEEIKGK